MKFILVLVLLLFSYYVSTFSGVIRPGHVSLFAVEGK